MSRQNVTSLHRQGCLFCRRTDGGFASREHIFPEALGNKELVLDRGVVCDRCNNGPLGAIDGALVNYQPIAFRRTLLRVASKRARVPESRWGNASITHTELGKLVITETGERPTIVKTGPNKFTLTLRSARPIRAGTYAKIARAIWKCTLEFVYLDQGAEEAFAPRYDEVRKMIVGVLPAHGVLVVNKTADPNDPSVSLTYTPERGDDGRDRVFVHARYFGVEIGTELLVREVMPIAGAEALVDIIQF